jgi:DNA polymerase IV (DinB-like DNA polymerase)
LLPESSVASRETAIDQRVILCVDLDYFYAQCEELRNPSLKEKPVVICVYSGRTKTSGAVSTANYVARKLGVKSGIPIVRAMKIQESRDDAVFLPVDFEFYYAISDEVMETVRRFSDAFEQVSVDEAFIDVTKKTSSDFAKAETLARELKEEILRQHGLSCTLGVGPSKLISKMAVDISKPNGLEVVLPSKVTNFLRNKPTGSLIGVGPKNERKLHQLGIRTLGQLALADPEILSKKFGKNLGPHLISMSKGIDNDPVAEREPRQMSKIVTLKANSSKYDFPHVVEDLIRNLVERLVATGKLATFVGIIVITTELKTQSRGKKLPFPTDKASDISSVASRLFEKFFEEEEVKARRVGVKLADLMEKEKTISDSKGLYEEKLTAFFSNRMSP